MFWALATVALFTLIYNIITVVAILRKRLFPPYFKLKFCMILNAVWCMSVVWLGARTEIGTYDRIWMVVYLLLIIWYAFILKGKNA
jgi:cellulose synthase/poly-beta-1,6-N-acetylglucosamine synthase-like glycosyltransferase